MALLIAVPLTTALSASVVVVHGSIAAAVPEVENPIPDKIGLGLIFACATAGGVFGAVIGQFKVFRTRERTRSWWTNSGIAYGFVAGLLTYLAAGAYQIIS